MSEPVNSVTMKVLQPLWNESSPRTNNCLAYSNYSYTEIGPKERALNLSLRDVLNRNEDEILYFNSKDFLGKKNGNFVCLSLNELRYRLPGEGRGGEGKGKK